MRLSLFILFVCFSGLLAAQDIKDMTLLNHWDEDGLPTYGRFKYNDIWGYTDCNAREYAILGSAQFILFFDITEPDTPVEVYRYDTGYNTIWRDFKTYGNYAYAVADRGDSGLLVFDLSHLPDTVFLANQIDDRFTKAHNIYIDEGPGRLYTAGGNGISRGTLIYDLTETPENPEFLAAVELPLGYIHDIHVRNNIGYCSHATNGLAVYDFTDPDSLRQLGSLTTYPEQGYNHSSWLSEDGNQLVMADETFATSLKLLDVSDPSDITLLSLFRSELLAPTHTNSIAHNPFIRGQYAIVSYYDDGVQIFDLSGPENVQQVAYYDTYQQGQSYTADGCWGVYPFFPSGNIIASDITNGMFILSADSIDWAPISPPELPDAAYSLLTEPMLCEGDTVLIQANDTSLQYTWLKNGELLLEETSLLQATESGTYQLMVSNGTCQQSSEVIEVAFSLPAEAVLPDTSFTYCGEVPPAIATSSEGGRYRWYLNGEPLPDSDTQILDINEGGLYQVEVFNGACRTLSNEWEVILGQMPSADYQLNIPSPLCTGYDTIYLDILDGFQQAYLLSEIGGGFIDTVENSYGITESGNYELEITNQDCNLLISPLVEASFFTPVPPSVTVADNQLMASEADFYQWYLEEDLIPGANEQTYTAEESGSYSVEIQDGNGCPAFSEAIEVTVINGTHIAEWAGLRVYPNPAKDQLRIESPVSLQAIQLYGPSGQLVEQLAPVGKAEVRMDTGHLPPGMYLLKLISNDASHQEIIIKY